MELRFKAAFGLYTRNYWSKRPTAIPEVFVRNIAQESTSGDAEWNFARVSRKSANTRCAESIVLDITEFNYNNSG